MGLSPRTRNTEHNEEVDCRVVKEGPHEVQSAAIANIVGSATFSPSV